MPRYGSQSWWELVQKHSLAEIGRMVLEYFEETEFQNFEGWTRRDATTIRKLLTDMAYNEASMHDHNGQLSLNLGLELQWDAQGNPIGESW